MNDLGARLRAPSLDATALEDPQGFFNNIIRRCAENVRVAMPCRIERYDRVNHIADLRVLFNWQMADGSIIDGCILKNITIRRLLAGGFLIDFPILEGDTGWLFACDRDAYDSKKESAPRLPTTPLVDSYESGFWLPDQWGDNNKLGISGVDQGRLVIQSKDGTQKISIGSHDINITATTLNIIGAVNVNGTLEVSGLITANGDLNNADGTSFTTHQHPTAGPGSPSSPTPGT